MQFILDIGALFNTQVCFTIKNHPLRASSTTPFDFIGTVIATNEIDNYATIFFAFTHKLRLVIRKMIEERKSYGLDEGSFACTVWAIDSRCASSKIYSEITITFNVL